jgi:hypothetical protein
MAVTLAPGWHSASGHTTCQHDKSQQVCKSNLKAKFVKVMIISRQELLAVSFAVGGWVPGGGVSIYLSKRVPNMIVTVKVISMQQTDICAPVGVNTDEAGNVGDSTNTGP